MLKWGHNFFAKNYKDIYLNRIQNPDPDPDPKFQDRIRGPDPQHWHNVYNVFTFLPFVNELKNNGIFVR